MELSSRVKAVPDSITLKLNDKANTLAEEGHQIFNLTAGQLPFKPVNQLIESLGSELNFLKSYQYAPVPGYPKLKEKVLNRFLRLRNLEEEIHRDKLGVVVSNGGKHSIYNALGTLLNPDDEVIMLAPYWVSYPEMIKFWGAKPVAVKSSIHNSFVPEIESIKAAVGPKTKLIILNSPNNPTGVHYPQKWMEEFADFLVDNPNLNVLSDEIYHELSYYDPAPTYFYQYRPELLDRAIIVDGISKSLACTGLRIGFTIAPTNFIKAMGKLQGQTTSGANSLIQRALMNFDFDSTKESQESIKLHLRNNVNKLRDILRDNGLSSCWYQTTSAFYFIIDFSLTPVFKRFVTDGSNNVDAAAKICEELLTETGVAIVPSSDFGIPNAARISLVSDLAPFSEAIGRLAKYLNSH